VGLDTMIEKTNKGEKNWLHKAITELMDGWMDGWYVGHETIFFVVCLPYGYVLTY